MSSQPIKSTWVIEVGVAPNPSIPTGAEQEFIFKEEFAYLRIKTNKAIYVSDVAGGSAIVGQGGLEGGGSGVQWSRLTWEAGSTDEVPWGRGKSVFIRYVDPVEDGTGGGIDSVIRIEARTQ